MTTSSTFRPLTAHDKALLARATLGNINWSIHHVTALDVEMRPEFRHSTVLKEERGDFGIVAEAVGEPIGVVWAQYLGASDPGHGFVGEAPPNSVFGSTRPTGGGWVQGAACCALFRRRHDEGASLE